MTLTGTPIWTLSLLMNWLYPRAKWTLCQLHFTNTDRCLSKSSLPLRQPQLLKTEADAARLAAKGFRNLFHLNTLVKKFLQFGFFFFAPSTILVCIFDTAFFSDSICLISHRRQQ